MRSFFLLLLLAASARGGEHRHFLLPVGPGGRSATVHAYVFDAGRETLRVLDQGGLEQQSFPDLGAAAAAAGANAGVNGGFFLPDGSPLGRFTADGKHSGSPDRSGGRSAGLLWSDGRKTGISRSAGFDFEAPGLTQVLQGGPFLIENGQAAAGLDASRFTRRTLVLTDGGKLWALAYVPGATLDGLARALAQPDACPFFQPRTALNLDGGSASGLWIKRQNGQAFYLREISKVRNFLVVIPKDQG